MNNQKIKFIDLFCGLGGFRLAIKEMCASSNCVFSCDFDADAQKSYEANLAKSRLAILQKSAKTRFPNTIFYLPVFRVKRSAFAATKKVLKTHAELCFSTLREFYKRNPRKRLFWKMSNNSFRTTEEKL